MTRKKKLVILLSAAVGALLVALLIWLMCLPGIRGYREMAVECRIAAYAVSGRFGDAALYAVLQCGDQ